MIRHNNYTSPVPSPEESVTTPRIPDPSMYPSSFFSNYHPHDRYSILKPVRSFHRSDTAHMIYHTRSMPGRKHSPMSHYMYVEPRKYQTSLPLEKASSKFESSQLLLKVTEPQSKASVNENIILASNPRPQQYPVYQKPSVVDVAQSLKTRVNKETVHNKTKTPTRYLTTADGEQRPQCPECFQTFKKRAALERHMMIHRGIKPFQCHFCNQRFRQKHHLQGHIMLHTGERPHSCTLCNKRFRMRHHLLEHERISHKLFR